MAQDRISASYLFAILVKAPLICLSTIVMGSISFACSLFDKTGNTQHQVARAWSRQLLAIGGVRVQVDGLDRIQPGGSYIFVSNHVSFMDTPVLMANLPVQFRFLAKRGLFQIPFLGNHLHRAGHIPIPRDDVRGTLKALTYAAEAVQQRGICLLVFPEGGRTQDDMALQEFKDGAAYLAVKSGVPVVPIGLVGMEHILPMGSAHVRAGQARMRIGLPIPTAGMPLKQHKALTQQLRQEVAALSGQQLKPLATSAPAESTVNPAPAATTHPG
ncbi:MAG: 1-acyl-sn-glycerol-3-phosphate acyltransferase [Bryobacterales bacterium]|jgi:1-acyl-sn-glycerol-3-phosphate acyltransferase|nr:1-acyl-sn-glycerol-3-phosphate acyltransferase [Bryobacterales bacterium]